MWVGIISIFPDMFQSITKYGITSRAIKNGFLNIQFWNPRFYTKNLHHTIDDRPYGGGPGMVMMFDPLKKSIISAKKVIGKNSKVIYLSPQGTRLTQKNVLNILQYNKLILICGRYRGIDERLCQQYIDEEWSIGDYVLSGGELPAMVLIDTIARLIPGVLRREESTHDSFSQGLLDYPCYTRPRVIDNLEVPKILLSGNHKLIDYWRRKQSLGRTWTKKPELLKNKLNSEQEQLLYEFQKEIKDSEKI
ncbi:tRNA (guanosine(37)-N1)-methyltransferase TrmD [Candidatus Tachikawaea gelatinosa]|uniref:tRNA (guanosine(37)-N1)-methyltransferase TrmD n=1 Tax=Candidatus Tachikawaea gelatinosa TaxID=1410383 RepID=UPI000596AE24|nr:tRNA (guanosine(37)-N1)-methyltransferase TrmD [Candidatus Tachikawaea gelatinosa]